MTQQSHYWAYTLRAVVYKLQGPILYDGKCFNYSLNVNCWVNFTFKELYSLFQISWIPPNKV